MFIVSVILLFGGIYYLIAPASAAEKAIVKARTKNPTSKLAQTETPVLQKRWRIIGACMLALALITLIPSIIKGIEQAERCKNYPTLCQLESGGINFFGQ
jgi:hypothetical protein